MSLIHSARFKKDDLQYWNKISRNDPINASRIERMEQKALNDIADFGETSVAVSWGKDSLVVAHLALRVNPKTVIWNAEGKVENPDNPAVSSAFLDRYPTTFHSYRYRGLSDMLGWVNKNYHPKNVSGVRAQESSDRRISRAVHGVSTHKMCRPIIDWPVWAVWAYLNLYDLPIHPAYAYSLGGLFNRDLIRVHSIGDHLGRGAGRREWEQQYYRQECDQYDRSLLI